MVDTSAVEVIEGMFLGIFDARENIVMETLIALRNALNNPDAWPSEDSYNRFGEDLEAAINAQREMR